MLWEGGDAFDAWRDEWRFDGPVLPLEFSRISKKSRNGALTLVIDPSNGTPTRVAYCLSRRTKISNAIEDLRKREGTKTQNIGYYRLIGESQAQHRETLQSIIAWAGEQALDGVVWTDLPSNFLELTGKQFTVSNATTYLKTLDGEASAKALEYIRKAPDFVHTPLRESLPDAL